jgi:hypothetical protein
MEEESVYFSAICIVYDARKGFSSMIFVKSCPVCLMYSSFAASFEM